MLTALQYALLNASHILFLGMFVGATLAMDMGYLRAPGFGWAMTVVGPLRRCAIQAFLGAAGTGLLLFMVRPSDYLQNTTFLAKMALVLLAAGNALAFQRVSSTRVRQTQAGLSLVLWLCVVFAGRWIGFSE